jgi:polar amino acid transport system substrate-binding protein
MESNIVKFLTGIALAVAAALVAPSLDLTAGAAMLRGRADCGSVYRVVRGDTLHAIAIRAYGTGDYQTIYEANRDVLASVSSIEIGDELSIPCRDGAKPRIGTVVRARAPEIRVETAPPITAPAHTVSAAAFIPKTGKPEIGEHDIGGPEISEVAFVTGSDFAPFVHPALPEGGMITELVRLSLSNAAPDLPVKIALVEDWTAHLDMLAQGTFDLGFPWYRPDCSKASLLGVSMRRRCAGFDFSDPLFEIAIGYYALADNQQADNQLLAATGYDQLSGRRICRPANHFTFDLEQQGLAAPNATLIIAPALADCFVWLERGAVDVVTLSKPLAEDEIARLGLAGRVAEIPALASVQTLHAVAPKGDPDGRASLDLVNAGLAKMKSSGRWFEVASRHLGAYNTRVR